MSPKSVSLSPIAPRKNMYKMLFQGLVAVLLILLIVAIVRAMKKSREGFEGGVGNLMYFFMPGCGHCEQFNPEWEKLQGLVDTNRASLKLTKIDGTDDANQALVDQYVVKGFPTIILEIGGKATPYDGKERTADAVFKWATGLLAK